MKRIIALFVMLACAALAFSVEKHSLIGATFSGNVESGTYEGESISGNFGGGGLYVSLGIYPTWHVGFFVSNLINFFPNGMLAKSDLPYDFFDSFAFNERLFLGLGLSGVAEEDGSSARLQFSPGLVFQGEMEVGKFGTKNNYATYSYDAFLFGFGAELQVAFPADSMAGFSIGLMASWLPVYKPNITVNYNGTKTKQDIDFDDYSRFQIGIVIGVALNR